ncbi:hypothetical protein SOVF_122080 [Spinacia oleracea]|nr:hypothetical protein SOVF_122080 [Spinacia oleracea]
MSLSTLQGQLMASLCKYSPHLQDLALTLLPERTDEICRADISGSNIKSLTIECSNAAYRVVIDAPNLEHLFVLNPVDAVICQFVKHPTRLVNAYIDIYIDLWKPTGVNHLYPHSSHSSQLVLAVVSVRSLRIEGPVFSAFSGLDCTALPIFHNLTHLEIEIEIDIEMNLGYFSGWNDLL